MVSAKKKTHEIFGVSNEVLADSYVDRGQLDELLQKYLRRPTHIALRGESKCGKSWLRQKNVPNAVVVQCRLKKTPADIYSDILSQLGIRFIVEQTDSTATRGVFEVTGELGFKLLAKLGLKTSYEGQDVSGNKYQIAGHDVNDLKFIAEIIKESGKRVVVEDFHYMSINDRKNFSFDLKALWDYGAFIIIIGVWSQSNLLVYLNTDLTGRIEEIPIYWTVDDLQKILDKGSSSLRVSFSETLCDRLISDSFGNAGILQKLTLTTLDEIQISEAQDDCRVIDDIDAAEAAGMAYAEQLNPAYQQFAKRVSSGIRNRRDSTGIYAHAMAVIMATADSTLMKGLGLATIFDICNKRQSRIQKGNLKTVLERFEELQVDDEGRGLVISFNESTDEVVVVDRQILLYRKYATVKWPWEDMIAEIDRADTELAYGKTDDTQS